MPLDLRVNQGCCAAMVGVLRAGTYTFLMVGRRQIREWAMQILFAWDANGKDDRELAEQVVGELNVDHDQRRAAIDMAAAIWPWCAVHDAWIERLAPQWPIKRQPAVDRSLLRLAVWELTQTKTPPKVVIDEAIELAKQFSTEHSASFINGVLDAVLREHQALTSLGSSSDARPSPTPDSSTSN